MTVVQSRYEVHQFVFGGDNLIWILHICIFPVDSGPPVPDHQWDGHQRLEEQEQRQHPEQRHPWPRLSHHSG